MTPSNEPIQPNSSPHPPGQPSRDVVLVLAHERPIGVFVVNQLTRGPILSPVREKKQELFSVDQ
jgi:hypothetical protein